MNSISNKSILVFYSLSLSRPALPFHNHFLKSSSAFFAAGGFLFSPPMSITAPSYHAVLTIRRLPHSGFLCAVMMFDIRLFDFACSDRVGRASCGGNGR